MLIVSLDDLTNVISVSYYGRENFSVTSFTS